MIPKWFVGIPFLENSADYFQYEVFDLIDLVAIAIGATAAYVILCPTQQRRDTS